VAEKGENTTEYRTHDQRIRQILYGELGINLEWHSFYSEHFRAIVDKIFDGNIDSLYADEEVFINRLQQFLGLCILISDFQLQKVKGVREDFDPLSCLKEFLSVFPEKREWHYFTGYTSISPFEKKDFVKFFENLSLNGQTLILGLIETSIGRKLYSREQEINSPDNFRSLNSLVTRFSRGRKKLETPLEFQSFFDPMSVPTFD